MVKKNTVKKIKKATGENLFLRKCLYFLVIVKSNIGKIISFVNHIPMWGPLKGPVSLPGTGLLTPKIST